MKSVFLLLIAQILMLLVRSCGGERQELPDIEATVEARFLWVMPTEVS